MRVGGGLRYVAGPMGAGKTLYGVRSIVRRVVAGQYVVTNVRLLDDAPERIARHYARTARSRAIVADKVRRFYVFETDLDTARTYRLPGKGEARGLFLWDEAHNDLNNRTYRDRDQSLLEWGTQLRKLGFEGVLLSQSEENTDAQFRRICNWRVRLQNQRESARVMGMRIRGLPPLFLASWYMANVPHGSRLKPVLVERYMLSWHKHLYDTLDLFHGLAAADDDAESRVIRLPEGGRRPTLAGTAPGASLGLPAGAPSVLQPISGPDSDDMPTEAERAALPTRPALETSDRIRRGRVLPEA